MKWEWPAFFSLLHMNVGQTKMQWLLSCGTKQGNYWAQFSCDALSTATTHARLASAALFRKVNPPQPLIFVSGQLKQVIISISPELTLIPRGFFFLSLSCHQVQFTSKTRVKPCTLALQEQREHGKAQLNTTALFPGIGLNLYARFKNPNQYLYEEKKNWSKNIVKLKKDVVLHGNTELLFCHHWQKWARTNVKNN